MDGANFPTGEAGLLADLDKLAEDVKRWEGIEVTERNQGLLADLKNKAVEIEKALKALKAERKAPHLAAAEAIESTFRPRFTIVEGLKDFVRQKLAVYLDAVEKKRREEAAAAAEAARQAQEAAASSGDPFAAFDAAEADARAQSLANTAKAKPKVRGAQGGRALSTRTYYTVEITDGPALVRHLAENPRMIAEAKEVAHRIVTAANGDTAGLPGIKVHSSTKVT